MTTATALVVYVLSLAPDVTLEFSGIFSVGGYYGGVPHPPAYPLWTVYAWLYSHLIPFGNVASRIALSSAIAGAVASGFVALIVSRTGRALFHECDSKIRYCWAARTVCGVSAGCLFAFDSAFWRKAIIVDVWPLSILLFVGTFLLLFRWSEEPGRRRFLRWAALTYGLTVSNSQALLVAAPGILAFVMLCEPKVFLRWKTVVACTLLFVLGCSAYFYAPLSSMTNPPANWSYARSAEGFLQLVSRGQYESVQPVLEVSRYCRQLLMYLTVTLEDFGVIVSIVSFVSFFYIRCLSANQRRCLIGGISIFACLSLLMVALLNPGFERGNRASAATFFTASHLFLAINAGFGMLLICRRLIKRL